MKVAIIGAGNGGQAMGAWIAKYGHSVSLYDRDEKKVEELRKLSAIELYGAVEMISKIDGVTHDIIECISHADLIMICTTANAHQDIAQTIAPYLKDEQVIVLNPGRTGGALCFRNTLNRNNCRAKVYVGEAQTLVFACRLVENGKVNIIGIKDRVLMSAIPASDNNVILEKLEQCFSCFSPAQNVLQTGFENIGAMFHPCVVLFNEASIERGEKFYFYRDMTDGLSRLIEQADKERLTVAQSFGYNPISASDWVSYAYGKIEGDTLCERMQNNPAYHDILAPMTINCRQITEDIPTGILPLSELGKVAGVPTPLFDSLICICSFLLEKDFREDGRTLDNLGLGGMTKQQIVEYIK